MDAVADTEDVAGVLRVPARGGVAEVSLRSEEEFEGDVGGGWGVADEVLWPVCFWVIGAKAVEFIP